MRRVLQAVWEFLREFSGEAALERHMACQCQADRQKAYESAVSEKFGPSANRCC